MFVSQPTLDPITTATSAQSGPAPRSPQREARRARVVARLRAPEPPIDDEARLAAAKRSVIEQFRPSTGWQEWIAGEVASLMVRISRSDRVERKLRDHASYRAIDFWDDDQRLEVEILAAKLPRHPARTEAKLRQTPAGIHWLLTRWRVLERVDPATWTDEQRTLATQLVGGDPALNPADPGFAASRIADLIALRPRVAEADALVRELVETDLADDRVPGLTKLRRERRALQRQLQLYLDQLAPAPDPAIKTDKTKPSSTPPSPRSDETKPLPPRSAPEIVKTNPLSPESEPESDELDPSWLEIFPELDEASPLYDPSFAALVRKNAVRDGSGADLVAHG